MHSLLRSATPHGLFFTVQRSTLKNHSQGRKPLPLVHYRRCSYRKDIIRYAVLVHCPEFKGCPLFRSRKCIASTRIAVGTSTEVCYTEEVCYWEGLLSEVPLYLHSLHVCVCVCSTLCRWWIYQWTTHHALASMQFSSTGWSAMRRKMVLLARE